MKLDGIFIDLYGTLTAGDRLAVETVCREIIEETGIPVSVKELSVAWGERFFEAIDASGTNGFETLLALEARTLRSTLAVWNARVDERHYAGRLRDYWRAPPLHPEVNDFLRQVDIPVCIVSNADQADAESALRRHAIRPVHVETSESARCYKPHRNIFDAALAATGWRRDRVIHVGDSLHSDVGGARAAGIRSVWINRAHRIHDVGTHRPDHEIDHLLNLLPLLNTLPPTQ